MSTLSVSSFLSALGPAAARRSATVAPAEAPPGGFAQALASATKPQEVRPLATSDYGIYANVVVDGKVVATVSNTGCAVLVDGLPDLHDMLSLDGHGPNLAATRARQIADALGGTVATSSSALTQKQFDEADFPPGAVDLRWIEDPENDESWRDLPPAVAAAQAAALIAQQV